MIAVYLAVIEGAALPNTLYADPLACTPDGFKARLYTLLGSKPFNHAVAAVIEGRGGKALFAAAACMATELAVGVDGGGPEVAYLDVHLGVAVVTADVNIFHLDRFLVETEKLVERGADVYTLPPKVAHAVDALAAAGLLPAAAKRRRRYTVRVALAKKPRLEGLPSWDHITAFPYLSTWAVAEVEARRYLLVTNVEEHTPSKLVFVPILEELVGGSLARSVSGPDYMVFELRGNKIERRSEWIEVDVEAESPAHAVYEAFLVA